MAKRSLLSEHPRVIFVFFLFKWLCWMVTLLSAVALERLTPKYIYFIVC